MQRMPPERAHTMGALPPNPRLKALWVLVGLLCVVATGVMLIAPAGAKVVDLVYGGF